MNSVRVAAVQGNSRMGLAQYLRQGVTEDEAAVQGEYGVARHHYVTGQKIVQGEHLLDHLPLILLDATFFRSITGQADKLGFGDRRRRLHAAQRLQPTGQTLQNPGQRENQFCKQLHERRYEKRDMDVIAGGIGFRGNLAEDQDEQSQPTHRQAGTEMAEIFGGKNRRHGRCADIDQIVADQYGDEHPVGIAFQTV